MKSKVVELSKGKYKVIIEAGKNAQTGKRRRIIRRVTGRRCDAESLCTNLVYQLEHGTYIEPSKTTLAEYLKEWFSTYSGNLAPSTAAGYEGIINKHLIPSLGHVILTNLQPIRIQSYYTEKLKKYKPRTIEQHHAILRESLQHAVKWQLLNRNPADATQPPRPKRATIKALTLEQVNSLLQAIRGNRDEYLIIVALYTGMRQGELLALTWDNVDMENKCIRVIRTVGHIKGEFVFRDIAKSKKSVREVLLDNRALSALRKQKATVAAEIIEATQYNNNNLVFPDPAGNPLNPTTLTRRFKQTIKPIDINFHGLRHTHATMLLSMGTHPSFVQNRLGHETISITLDTYSHVTRSMQEEVVKKLNDFHTGKI